MLEEEKKRGLWNSRYSLGIPEIDKEHKKLFSIIEKIIELTENNEDSKVQHACREGVKFFKNYTIKHFAHEESLMESLNYEGYERHKKIHNDLRENVIPAIEKELEENEYSIQSVRHFLGICTAWLSTHIKSEDQRILRKQLVLGAQMNIGKQDEQFEQVLKNIIQDIYQIEIETISKCYTGWDFGKAIFHEMTYVTEERKVMHIIYALEEKLIFSLASESLGIEFKKVDEFLLAAVREILFDIGKKIGVYMGIESNYKSRSGVMLQTSEIETIFRDRKILYSTLFKSDRGNFACSIYER